MKRSRRTSSKRPDQAADGSRSGIARQVSSGQACLDWDALRCARSRALCDKPVWLRWLNGDSRTAGGRGCGRAATVMTREPHGSSSQGVRLTCHGHGPTCFSACSPLGKPRAGGRLPVPPNAVNQPSPSVAVSTVLTAVYGTHVPAQLSRAATEIPWENSLFHCLHHSTFSGCAAPKPRFFRS